MIARVDLMQGKKRIAKVILIVLMTGFVIQILFDPLSSFLQLSENLQARVALPVARFYGFKRSPSL